MERPTNEVYKLETPPFLLIRNLEHEKPFLSWETEVLVIHGLFTILFFISK